MALPEPSEAVSKPSLYWDIMFLYPSKSFYHFDKTIFGAFGWGPPEPPGPLDIVHPNHPLATRLIVWVLVWIEKNIFLSNWDIFLEWKNLYYLKTSYFMRAPGFVASIFLHFLSFYDVYRVSLASQSSHDWERLCRASEWRESTILFIMLIFFFYCFILVPHLLSITNFLRILRLLIIIIYNIYFLFGRFCPAKYIYLPCQSHICSSWGVSHPPPQTPHSSYAPASTQLSNLRKKGFPRCKKIKTYVNILIHVLIVHPKLCTLGILKYIPKNVILLWVFMTLNWRPFWIYAN